MTVPPEDKRFAQLMLTLRPYRGDIVVIGGWAHRLSRLHSFAQAVEFEPLGTQDVDLAIPGRLPPGREQLDRLLTEGGFKERFLGEEHPPVTHYQLGDEPAFYAEFLTPLIGRPKTATTTIAGVSAQALRYLDILLIESWSVQISEPNYPVGSKPLEIRIANATSYLAQKVLVLAKRAPSDRAKDILYIHDTILMFGRALPNLHMIWRNSVRPAMHSGAIKVLESASQELFTGAVLDAVRGASQIATEAGRPVTPDEVAAVCRRGLETIFA